MPNFIKNHRKKILLGAFAGILLLQFNNCGGKLNSQMNSAVGGSSVAAIQTANNEPDTPVNRINPYYVQCIHSSDGARISSKLSQSVQIKGLGTNAKLSSVDWNQDEDLIVTIDNACLRQQNYNDPILAYVNPNDIQADRHLTVYTIPKEEVKNLKLFIENALSSECLIATEKNEEVKIKAEAADPGFSSQKHLSAVGVTESVLSTIMSYNGGLLYTVKVAIIDTGIDTAHPDLRDQIARNASGQVIGYNSTTTSNDYLTDSGYHGTHVAGLIGATFRNGISGSGIWGRNIKLYPVRGSNNGDTFKLADLANAIIWAADQGVDLINLSLGTPSESSTIKNAISYAIGKNVTIVVASGNDGYQLSASNPQYPAMYSTQFQGLITVGSVDATTRAKSGFSNYSSTYVDIMAPGGNGSTGIYSTVPTSITSSGFASRTTYEDGTSGPIQGTSMAAPLVTGALAAGISIAKGKGYNYTNSQLKNLLKAGSTKMAAYTSYSASGNYLNLPVFYNQIRYSIESTNPPPTPPPTTNTLEVILQPVARQAVAGERIELSVDATSDTAITYQWYRNDIKIEGATAKNLSLQNLSEAQSGLYHAEITAGAQKSYSNRVSVIVAVRYCN